MNIWSDGEFVELLEDIRILAGGITKHVWSFFIELIVKLLERLCTLFFSVFNNDL
jgi:hypothetical protein